MKKDKIKKEPKELWGIDAPHIFDIEKRKVLYLKLFPMSFCIQKNHDINCLISWLWVLYADKKWVVLQSKDVSLATNFFLLRFLAHHQFTSSKLINNNVPNPV